MALIKYIFKFVDWSFGMYLGITAIDFFKDYAQNDFSITDVVDARLKLVYMIVGLIYFILRGIHEIKMRKLDREEKRLRNKMLNEDFELKEWETSQKINKKEH